MGRVLALALLGVGLLSVALPAQERARPANPSPARARGHEPSRRPDVAGPPASQLPGSNWVQEPDLFRARPSTYAPRYDRTFRRGTSWGQLNPGYGYPGFYADPVAPVAPVVELRHEHPPFEYDERRRNLDPPVTPPAAQVPVPPAAVAPPRTFYVIPRCYAGDAPPRPEQLPPGCDRAALRVVPPRAFDR